MSSRSAPEAAAPRSRLATALTLGTSRPLSQRRCGCGGTPGPDGECVTCRAKRLDRQRQSADGVEPATIPPIVHDVLRSPGQPLGVATRAFMEPRFGHDFSRVRVHTDAQAAESARAVNALAYTVGRDVVFGAGQYAPNAQSRQRLVAHELAHVLQQSAHVHNGHWVESLEGLGTTLTSHLEAQADAVADRLLVARPLAQHNLSTAPAITIQRQRLGTRVTQPAGATSRYRRVTATFDGQEFVMTADGTEILRASGDSGRPYTVRPADVARCSGSLDDSYLNNPRYVGIADNGPIPEGRYQFRTAEMSTFSLAEQAQMMMGGRFIDPFGNPLHGGDWGAGRVALRPMRVLPARLCGNTATRSGFYLHGGIMPGSSGCIDIGNSPFSQLVSLLTGYRGPILVTVHYTRGAPSVGFVRRALGRFMYPPGQDPGWLDRLKSLLDF